MSLQTALQTFMAEKGLTQADVARLADVAPSTVSKVVVHGGPLRKSSSTRLWKVVESQEGTAFEKMIEENATVTLDLSFGPQTPGTRTTVRAGQALDMIMGLLASGEHTLDYVRVETAKGRKKVELTFDERE
jgi:hypothetical protein